MRIFYAHEVVGMARKKSVNLSIDAELVAEAKALGVNMSAVLEKSLRAAHHELRQQVWRDDNAEAIQEWNALLDQDGIWADKYRT